MHCSTRQWLATTPSLSAVFVQNTQPEMEDPANLAVKTKKYLRSALLSTKGGVPAEQVYRDYRDLVGEGIPYRRLGYETLENFLTSVPDVCKISRKPTGEVVVVAVADENTRHIQDLVSRQATKSKKKAKPKRPSRKPMQQSTHWDPPQQQQQPAVQQRVGGSGRFPSQQRGRGGGGGGYQAAGTFRGPGRPHVGGRGMPGGGGGGRGRGQRFNMHGNGAGPLREPRGGYHGQPRGGGGGAVSPRGGGQPGRQQQAAGPANNVKTPPKSQPQPKQPKSNFKRDLQQYFNTNNLGDVPYKIATMGNKGKEKYMATVTVEGEQFKTYPQTFNTQLEAEEALAQIIVKKLGIRGTDGAMVQQQETTDTTVFADRVVELIGERHNGVWSTQIEKQYQDQYGEKLPSLWFQEVEAISRIRVDCPIPGSGRYIVFPCTQAAPAPAPPRAESSPEGGDQLQPAALCYPEDELWDVFITFVRSTTNISVRLIGRYPFFLKIGRVG